VASLAFCAKAQPPRLVVSVKLTILGEQENLAAFWNYFAQAGRSQRRACRELLFEQQTPLEQNGSLLDLRLATPDDLPLILPVYAEMVYEESEVNPLEVDPVGFEKRWLRRIEQGRVWVWIDDGRLMFNADVMSKTPDVIYLEGIYVNPDERGGGLGVRCLSQLVETFCNERDRCACWSMSRIREPEPFTRRQVSIFMVTTTRMGETGEPGRAAGIAARRGRVA